MNKSVKSRAKSCKIAIIGAGNVGSTLAMRVAEAGLADVVLVDILDGVARGKAMDISNSLAQKGIDSKVTGGGDYEDMKGSGVVVITAGLARKPGMSREELGARNAGTIKAIVKKVKEFTPESILLVITNPLDAMSYIAYKESGFGRSRVMGMAGQLDESRLKTLMSQRLNLPPDKIDAVILGVHGDKMVIPMRFIKVNGRPIGDILKRDEIGSIIEDTRTAGADIVSLLGSGSAYYAPSQAAYLMLDSIINDKREVFRASAYLDGEYGFKDISMGVPVKLGNNGIIEILELELNDAEKAELKTSADAIHKAIERLR